MQSNDIKVGELSFVLSNFKLPFELIGSEFRLGPDDWAWQFLRLNKEYRAGYERFAAKELKENESQTLLKKFGLSAWVNPDHLRLPEKNFAWTWFQPLMEPVEATEWDANTHPDEIQPQSPEFSLQVAHIPPIQRNASTQLSTAVWYAIDCSVPPAGQLEYVRQSAKDYREWFKDEGVEKPSEINRVSELVPLDQCKYFDASGFKFAEGSTDKSTSLTRYWRAIRVDVLGRIAEQVENYRKDLEGLYQEFRKDDSVAKPFRERFRSTLPGLKEEYGEHNSDGFFLKILVIVEQLSENGMSDKKIAEYITSNSCYKSWNAGPALSWVSDLAERIPKYRLHAADYIEKGYRWLIHAQKP